MVAYRTIDAAQSKPEYQYVWNGAKWFFLSEENRRRFSESPEIYAPEYDGFCALSVAKAMQVESDPQQWQIVDGKLYLLQSGTVKEVWEKSSVEFIKQSDANWEKIKQNKSDEQ